VTRGELATWLEKFDADIWHDERLLEVAAMLRDPETCVFTEAHDGEYWTCSACGYDFVLLEGTPEENDYHYCANCGAKVTACVPFKEDDDDE